MSGLVEIARFQNTVEADLARMLLESAGLTAIPFDEGMNHVGLGPIMPIRLMVLESEFAEAAELLVDEELLD